MVAGTAVDTKEYVQQLKGAKEAVRELVTSKKSNPILVRLGWHDAGTYDKELGLENWPRCGGANGSMRFKPEQSHSANAGLANAVLLLEDIKKQFPQVSHADLYQLASAVAVEVAGGPTIPLKFGRVDAAEKDDCVVDGKLPSGDPESTHKQSPADHLRKVFYRMGLNDQEIVVLSGAHTLGRVYPDRSGFGKASTKYTENGPGTKGGSSWTPEWLKFDNSYFKEVKARTDPELVVLSTDGVLFQDEKFRAYAEKYAEDQDLFFKDYVLAHKKLSELGAKFDPPEGIVLDAQAVSTTPAASSNGPVKFSAKDYYSEAASTPRKSDLSPEMKEKIRKEYLGFGGSADTPVAGGTNPFVVISIIVAVLALLSKAIGAI